MCLADDELAVFAGSALEWITSNRTFQEQSCCDHDPLNSFKSAETTLLDDLLSENSSEKSSRKRTASSTITPNADADIVPTMNDANKKVKAADTHILAARNSIAVTAAKHSVSAVIRNR